MASPTDDLETALASSEEARRVLGAMAGELQEAKDAWGAAAMAQAEWNERIDLLLRQLAEANERERQLTERLDAVDASRSWRLLQLGLAPYRLVRSGVGRVRPAGRERT